MKQIYLAIRNHGYTNYRPHNDRLSDHLRRLKEFETHEGGFCLYSREFHSPGLCYTKRENRYIYLDVILRKAVIKSLKLRLFSLVAK